MKFDFKKNWLWIVAILAVIYFIGMKPPQQSITITETKIINTTTSIPTTTPTTSNSQSTTTNTCAQTASQGGYYYKEGITKLNDGTLNSCFGYSNQDCIEKGKVLSDFGLQPNCCLYKCTDAAIPACTDTDGGVDYYVYGEATSNVDNPASEVDTCVGNTLYEKFCVAETKMISQAMFTCTGISYCDAGRCRFPNCEDIAGTSQAQCSLGELPAAPANTEVSCVYIEGVGCSLKYTSLL